MNCSICRSRKREEAGMNRRIKAVIRIGCFLPWFPVVLVVTVLAGIGNAALALKEFLDRKLAPYVGWPMNR